MAKHEVNTPAHLAFQTQSSRTGEINYVNRKPYRSKAQKELARETARKGKDGTFHSSAPVSYHTKAAASVT